MIKRKKLYNNKSPKDRFEQGYIPEPMSGCWLWVRSTDEKGYGRFSVLEYKMKAHRFSAFLHGLLGDLKDNTKHVCHKCDNRSCVNPEHLYIGTHEQNMKDMYNKGRHPFGTKSGMSKLTEEIVRSARKDSRSGYALAKIYGVKKQTMAAVLKGKTWKHVK